MAATLVVCLFLPNTLNFHNDSEKNTSPVATIPTSRSEKRKSSTLDLLARSKSAVSLFDDLALERTPGSDDIFGPFTGDSQLRRDPRSLLKSDSEVYAWGAKEVFNQPRFRAAPLPSGSILDFAKVCEEIHRQERRANRGIKSPPARESRDGSSERGYETKSWTVEAPLQGNGGLVNAMRAAQKSGVIEITWVGTIGFPTDSLPENKREEISDHLINEYQSEIVYVSDKDLYGHYSGYCKTLLWPILNYQVPDSPRSKAYLDHSWRFYCNVNQAFADKIVDSYKRGDTIWVHDYHLLLVPRLVRQRLPEAQIGFFLHTAFPSSEVFRCLANRKELLEGVLGANLIAFQTDESVQHFLQTCSRLLTLETTGDGVQLTDDRFVNVTSQPIGIDPTAIYEARQAEEVQEWVTTIQERYKDKFLVVARDKLDDVHGIRQKLLAYELFLNKNPEFAGKTVMIQVATSTDENLLTTISNICTRIDNTHSSLVHQPLVFLKQDIDLSQYLALLTVADAVIISSTREGMNLTAHEYVLCQDKLNGVKKHGPLILSEFTGASAILRGQITINPWHYRQMADAIKYALEMDETEKERRWRRLHATVLQNTGGHWAEQLSKTLAKVYEEQNSRISSSIPRLSVAQISEKYKQSKQRLFFLDYEGTLAPRKTGMGIPLAQPQRIIDTCNELMADSKNIVYVMSGSGIDELENVFHAATGLGLIAENGCFLKEVGATQLEWQSFVDLGRVDEWKKDVKSILKYYSERMEGSYTEERDCSLIFRYEKVEDQAAAMRQAGDCADQVNNGCKSLGLQAVPIQNAILVEHIDFNKATAAKSVFDYLRDKMELDHQDPIDFLMVAGDDREDEGVFRMANQLGKEGSVQDVFTVSIGKRNSEAQSAMTQGSTGLLSILQKLAKISIGQMPVDYFNSPRRRGS